LDARYVNVGDLGFEPVSELSDSENQEKWNKQLGDFESDDEPDEAVKAVVELLEPVESLEPVEFDEPVEGVNA
jgi:hypothetical protein